LLWLGVKGAKVSVLLTPEIVTSSLGLSALPGQERKTLVLLTGLPPLTVQVKV
jgi:hypothetical protein